MLASSKVSVTGPAFGSRALAPIGAGERDAVAEAQELAVEDGAVERGGAGGDVPGGAPGDVVEVGRHEEVVAATSMEKPRPPSAGFHHQPVCGACGLHSRRAGHGDGAAVDAVVDHRGGARAVAHVEGGAADVGGGDAVEDLDGLALRGEHARDVGLQARGRDRLQLPGRVQLREHAGHGVRLAAAGRNRLADGEGRRSPVAVAHEVGGREGEDVDAARGAHVLRAVLDVGGRSTPSGSMFAVTVIGNTGGGVEVGSVVNEAEK